MDDTSTNGRFVKLYVDWFRSSFIRRMAREGKPGAILAWLSMLSECRYQQRQQDPGTFVLWREEFCQRYGVTEADVETALAYAREAKALTVNGEMVTLTNWKKYQKNSNDRRKEATGKRERKSDSKLAEGSWE